jgi:hypothetical protein
MRRPNLSVNRSPATRRRKTASRRGITILLVLMLMSVTLALSFSILRSQMTTVLIQNNSVRNNTARQDAISGLTIAMRHMSDGTWGGVGSTVSGNLTSNDSYLVTYTAGDASLVPGSSTYGDYAYRVTILSTGTSLDPTNSAHSSTYQVQAVMRLNPRALAAAPSNWSTMTQYTLYQYEPAQLSLDLPCQVAGPVWLQGSVSIGQNYAWSGGPENRYMNDLYSMASTTDDRPLTGPVNMPYQWSTSNTLNLLQSLGVQTVNNWQWYSGTMPTANLLLPSTAVTYCLYQGGPVYTATAVSGSLTNTTLSPNVTNNPLGIYYASSSLTIGNNVSIQGTLICNGQLTINGTGVSLTPFSLSALSGTTNTIRLPTVITTGSFDCGSGVGVTATGTLLVGGQFIIANGTQTTAFNLTGHVICGNFTIQYRNEWNVSAAAWNSWFNSFNGQPSNRGQVAYPYFPNWLATVSHPPTPLIALKLDTSAVTDQWQSLSGPIYVPATGDTGLYWNLMSWIEIP